MKKKTYAVCGHVKVPVNIYVRADNEQEAEDIAFSKFVGLDILVGNGGYDRLVGPSQRGVSFIEDHNSFEGVIDIFEEPDHTDVINPDDEEDETEEEEEEAE